MDKKRNSATAHGRFATVQPGRNSSDRVSNPLIERRIHHEEDILTDFARSCRPAAVGETERASRGASLNCVVAFMCRFHLFALHPSSFLSTLFSSSISHSHSPRHPSIYCASFGSNPSVFSTFSQAAGEFVLPVDLQAKTRGAHSEAPLGLGCPTTGAVRSSSPSHFITNDPTGFRPRS